MSNKYLVYFLCDAGISTSIMTAKMMEVVQTHDLPLDIEAHSVALADNFVQQKAPALIVLGPQVKYLKDKVDKQFDCDVFVMDTNVYANLDAKTAVRDILNLLRQ